MIDITTELKIVKKGLLSLDSIDYLFDLYLPLIGSNATFLYVFLLKKVRGENVKTNFTDLINESGLDLQTFMLSKKSLESIGLISFLENKNDTSYMILVNDALTPKNFFSNLILKGLFVQTVGEKKLKDILKKYDCSIDDKQYKDISAKINDSFVIDFNPSFIDVDSSMNLESINKNVLKDDFSDVNLFNYLKKNTQISITAFSDEELDFIHSVATLYGLKEKDIGALLVDCFDFTAEKGKKLDKDKLKKVAKTYVRSYKVSTNKTDAKTVINSTSDLASLVKYYESISPRKFLMSKQNGVEISDADKNLLEELKFNLGFSNGIINALIDYVLRAKNGELSRNYILKIGTTLIRKGCKNTLDCINILNRTKQDISKAKKENDTYKPLRKDEDDPTVIKLSDLEDDDDYKFFDEED